MALQTSGFSLYFSASFIPNRRWWLVAIWCLLIFYSAGLYRSNQRWREAANLSKSILNDLALSRQDALLVLNVPENLRGVPVYQNGLEQALRTFQPFKKISQVDVASFQTLRSTSDMIEIRREANLFSIRLLEEKADFSRVNDHLECVLIEERSKNSVRIRLRDCITGKEVFVFQGGRMSEVSTVQR